MAVAVKAVYHYRQAAVLKERGDTPADGAVDVRNGPKRQKCRVANSSHWGERSEKVGSGTRRAKALRDVRAEELHDGGSVLDSGRSLPDGIGGSARWRDSSAHFHFCRITAGFL